MDAGRLVLLCAVLAAGCAATQIERTPGRSSPPIPRELVVEGGRAEVWARAVPCLARRFFVDGADAATGVLKVTYAGAPERLVDGGALRATVRGGEGMPSRTTVYPVAAASQVIPVETALGTYELHRSVSLDATLQLLVEPAAPGKVRVSQKARLQVTRTFQERPPGSARPPPPARSTVTFDSGTPGAFLDEPRTPFLEGLGREVFWSTGVLEAEALACFAAPSPR